MLHTAAYHDIKISDLDLTCFQGKDISATLPIKSFERAKTSISLSCSSCPRSTYSLFQGKLYKQGHMDTFNLSHIECYECPFGGYCMNGRIKATDNFWGCLNKENGSQVRFVACPLGYCCTEGQCQSYNSCSFGRFGVLCGRCQKNLTENIMTPNCLKPEQCHHPWVYITVIAGGLLYVLLLMYIKEVGSILSCVLMPQNISHFARNYITNTFHKVLQCIKYSYEMVDVQVYNSQSLNNNLSCDSEDGEEMPLRIHCANNLPMLTSSNNQDADLFFSGALKIILFFYQTIVLYKVYHQKTSEGNFHFIQEIVSMVFNLRTDGLFYQQMYWCPSIFHLLPVSKLLFKISFIIYIFVLILMLFLASKLCQIYKGKNQIKLIKFITRLQCCTLRFLLISYATVTVSSFTLVSCINIGHFGRVLHIDGFIQCFQSWQYIVLVIICFWIAPYPLAIYASSWLFHHNKLHTTKFCLSLFFPFPTLMYWIYIRLRHLRCMQLNTKLQEVTLENKSSELLTILEGPFRTLKANGIKQSDKLPWESILIGRRLVLIIARIFITDIMVRQYVMLFFTILFLLHHIYVQPFKSKFHNVMETLSLTSLSVICALNLLLAYLYMNSVSLSVYSQGFVKTFQNIETALMLAIPFVTGICVAIFLCIRIFHCMIWLTGKFLRSICQCIKRRSLS